MLKSLLIPTDDLRQQHRLKRWMMATGASIMVIALFFAAYLLDLMDRRTFVTAALLIVGFVILFYAIFRSGMYLRFRDASLTLPQILASTLVILYVMYQSKSAHGVLALIYMLSFFFGVFRLSTSQLLAVTAFVASSYGLIIGMQWYPEAATDPSAFNRMVLNWIVLTAVLAFFSVMGGYISRLRKNLADSKVSLQDALERIRHLVSRDDLTGVQNRRSLTDFLERQKSRNDRFGGTFSVLMIDIDNFKRINDTHGHHAGDEVLITFARAAAASLRQTDVFGRYGGEEFLAILEQTPAQNIRIVGERMCAMARELRFDEVAPGLRITVSIGAADYRMHEGWQATVERADQALYRAKARGRDRLELPREHAS